MYTTIEGEVEIETEMINVDIKVIQVKRTSAIGRI